MRAFRKTTHENGDGYCGYLQMTSRSDNYARYVLGKLIDSLEQPYKPGDAITGLTRLAQGLFDTFAEIVPDGEFAQLREQSDPEELAKLVFRLSQLAVQCERLVGIDPELLRAFLFLISDDVRMRGPVLKWLRCEELSAFDCDLLRCLAPRSGPEMPLAMITSLGRLIAAIRPAALVLLVDQIEEVIELGKRDADQWELFRTAINTVVDIADGIPNAVVVISCLDQLFDKGRDHLPRTKLDRLLCDPEPITLKGGRTEEEIAALLIPRLEVLADASEVKCDPSSPIAPFRPEHLKPLVGLRTRDVLDWFRLHRQACIDAGEVWVEPHAGKPRVNDSTSTLDLTQLWNDFRGTAAPPLSEEPQLAEMLSWVASAASAEMSNGVHFGASATGRFIEVETHTGENTVTQTLVAICDRNPQGGGLGTQIDEVVRRAGNLPAILVRSTDYPKSPRAAASVKIANLIRPTGKGLAVVVANADWRTMSAFRAFHQKYQSDPRFLNWQRSERPLAGLAAVRAILELDRLDAISPPKPVPPLDPPLPSKSLPKPETKQPTLVQPAAKDSLSDPVPLGETRGVAPNPVTLKPADLTRHAAFLGGSGSGKTTAALTVIESLLLRGVPAVLVDRKGDLGRYADPTAWTEPDSEPDRARRRNHLRESIDVRVYTPGANDGRTLAIPIAPADLHTLPAADREQFAGYAAASLLGMMGPRPRGIDPKQAILQKAIEVLGRVPGRSISVPALHQLVKDRDPSLLLEAGGLDDKHFRKLEELLLSFALQHRRLLDGDETLDVDQLLGRGSHATPGKTRLTIVNTQFLGDSETIDFWLAQFLSAVDRWRAKTPAPEGRLQAVFLLDEADKYLPASGKVPSTRAPLESLLRRGRSAGISVFLASQSPGDFDYRARDQILTWLVGKVTQPVALNKLKPLFEAVRLDASAQLPGQAAGQFVLLKESEGRVIRVDRNLIPTFQLPEDRTLQLSRMR